MAYVIKKSGICYIDTPKTGSTWVKQTLSQLSHGNSDGTLTHGLPNHYDYEIMFTTIREPAQWLASVFAHRCRNRWEPYNSPVPWRDFCAVLDICKDTRFEPFIEKVCTLRPGIVTWFFGIYTPPGVQVYALGRPLYRFLSELGTDPTILPPTNVGHKVPYVDDNVKQMVAETESFLYNHYAFL